MVILKKIIRIFFIISLVCFSFFYTDKVMNLLNSKDPLMVKLNNIKKDYEVLPVNAIIDNDTIVPGKKGLEVDIDKSYEEMRREYFIRDLTPNEVNQSMRDIKWLFREYKGLDVITIENKKGDITKFIL